jgi:hypothetical protein
MRLGPLDRAIAGAKAALAALGSSSRAEMALVMTLVVLLYNALHAPHDVNMLLVLAALLWRPLRYRAEFWFLIGAFRLVYFMPGHWSSIDNHQYLITWWCLGLGFALLARDREVAIAVTGRRLIGLCFGFATAWKIMAPDFLSGRFMHWTLIADGRFTAFSENLLGLPAGGNASNRQAVQNLKGIDLEQARPVDLITSGLFQNMGVAIGWWTVFIEGSIALLFLLPERFRVTRWRNWALLIFIVTTYPLAPVGTFAWLLLAMAVASTPKENRSWVPVALITFLLITLLGRMGDVFGFIGGLL